MTFVLLFTFILGQDTNGSEKEELEAGDIAPSFVAPYHLKAGDKTVKFEFLKKPALRLYGSTRFEG